MHTVGGKAIDIALDVFAETNRRRPIRGLWFSLIHAYLRPSARNIAAARDGCQSCGIRHLGGLFGSDPMRAVFFEQGFVQKMLEAEAALARVEAPFAQNRSRRQGAARLRGQTGQGEPRVHYIAVAERRFNAIVAASTTKSLNELALEIFSCFFQYRQIDFQHRVD